MACYFHYYVGEDDRPELIPSFVSRIVDAKKEPGCKRSKLSDREPLNWLPKLSYFENNFFLATVGLLILKNYSKGT